MKGRNDRNWPKAEILGLRNHEPETCSVEKISTSARPPAADMFLADGMVRSRFSATLARLTLLASVGEAKKVCLAQVGKGEDGFESAGTYARHIFNRLLIDLSWNSSRLEGNTYTILDVYVLLEFNDLRGHRRLQPGCLRRKH